VPHLARQAISNGTQKLHMLHINFVMIHKKYYWPWLVRKYGSSWHTECFGTCFGNALEPGTLNALEKYRYTFTKRLPTTGLEEPQGHKDWKIILKLINFHFKLYFQ